MKYKIEKSAIKIIFIDTFALIEFSKNNSKDKRYEILYATLVDLVRAKKIICPIAYQEDEINEQLVHTMSIFSKLSLGIRFDSTLNILMKQYNQMLANVSRSETICIINYNDAFTENIESQIKQIKDIIITVNYEVTDKEIQERTTMRKLNTDELNDFKETEYNFKNYEEQLEHEFTGMYQAALKARETYLIKVSNNIEISEAEINQFLDLYISPYKVYKHNFPKGVEEEFLNSLLSDDFRNIPRQDIYTRMIADHVVSTKKFETGDPQDIYNLSALIPYSDIVITDRAQKNRIKRLKLDSKYKTDVYCMNDFDELIKELRSI